MNARMLIGLVLVLCGVPLEANQAALAAHEQIVTAIHFKKAPTGLDDMTWQKAPALRISFNGAESSPAHFAEISSTFAAF